MMRILGILLATLVVTSCKGPEAGTSLTTEELAKVTGVQALSATVSLNEGDELYLGRFGGAGQRSGFVRFVATERLVDARVVLAYWKTDKSLEANYGYITPRGDSGTGRFTVPQPYTGVTASASPYKVGEAFAFLRFEGTDTYVGYWITPNEQVHRTP
jgi:hypothetical protein